MFADLIQQDRFWGVVLIALGLASLAFQPFERVEKYINASTDTALTLILILLGVAAIVIGVKAPSATKALAIVWIVTP